MATQPRPPNLFEAPEPVQEVNPDDLARVFDRVSTIMYEISGVNLTASKRELVRARLSKRMRDLGSTSFSDYVRFVESEEGREELARMVDHLTTNKTSFFRELPHFVFLREEILPRYTDCRKALRIWSAGCSSGEEPYSLSILLHQVFRDVGRRDMRILGTDLSRRALVRAREGVYEEHQMEGIPDALRRQYFLPVPGGAGEPVRYSVSPQVRSLVKLAPLNLMERWPMRGPFDVIMCRNVMIYFDRETRERLVQRFARLLSPEGYLMVGHSESLNGLTHTLQYVQPAVYLA